MVNIGRYGKAEYNDAMYSHGLFLVASFTNKAEYNDAMYSHDLFLVASFTN